MAFLQIFVSQQLLFFTFKTSGWNVECDGLCSQSNRSLSEGRSNFTKKYGRDWGKSPIIHSQYHYHYGHCFTLDIAALSENQGKYKMKYGSHKMTLTLFIKGEIESKFRWKHTLVFIHNGTDINQFGESIKGRPVYSGYAYDVSLSGNNLKKVRMTLY